MASMEASMEASFEKACADRTIPGAVLLAANRSDTFRYENAFGSSSLKDPSSNPPLQMDSIMWMASCTKLMTCIAALQLVEKGQLNLDGDVSSILPELAELQILVGFEDGKPQFRKRRNKITLRLLLTHSSGLTYGGMHPVLAQWYELQSKGLNPEKTMLETYVAPLVFEPGTAWAYGPGIDFAGRMVERVTKSKLENYFMKHIWAVLGIKDMTFHLDRREDLRRRYTHMSKRDSLSDKVRSTQTRYLPLDATDDFGGLGLYSSGPDYIKLIQAILKSDGRLLKQSTVEDMMFKPHLSDEAQASMMAIMAEKSARGPLGALPSELEKNHSLAGLLLMEDLPDSRRKGTLTWGGLPNLTWFIDRDTDLCGIYASQLLPPGDPKTIEMRSLFEKTMYERARQGDAKL